MDAWLRLVAVPGISYAEIKRLLELFGEPENIFDARGCDLVRHIGEQAAARIVSDRAEAVACAAARWQERPGCSVMTFIDPGYPRELLAGGAPPPLLWLRGNSELLRLGKISVFGTQCPDREGEMNAAAMSAAIVKRGVALVSAMRRGVGESAVRGALEAGGPVIGVTASGPDIVSPAKMKPLYDDLLACGGVTVSIFPPGTPASKETESGRLQVFASIASAHLVIQAERSPHVFSFARAVADFDRELLAVPGTIHSPLYKGNHQLLRQGARLVESGEDIFAGWERINLSR